MNLNVTLSISRRYLAFGRTISSRLLDSPLCCSSATVIKFLPHVSFSSAYGAKITISDASTMELSYKIRPLKEEDIPEVIEITRANTFQYPVTSLRSWMAYDPEGILVAVLDTGEVLGVCGCVKNSEKLYVGGIFCVKEEYRIHDIGNKLYTLCFDHAKSENIAVNCPSEKLLHTYKRRGFNFFERNWTTLEYETCDAINHELLEDYLPEGVDMKIYHDTLFPAMIAYDYSLVGFDRTEILNTSVHEDDCLTLVAMKGRTCVGYGSIKYNIQGAGRVGPLYADEPCVAETMLKRLIIGMPEAKGFAMVTVSNNVYANSFLKKLGVEVHDNSIRIYSKERLICDFSKIYAQFDVDFASF